MLCVHILLSSLPCPVQCWRYRHLGRWRRRQSETRQRTPCHHYIFQSPTKQDSTTLVTFICFILPFKGTASFSLLISIDGPMRSSGVTSDLGVEHFLPKCQKKNLFASAVLECTALEQLIYISILGKSQHIYGMLA